MGPKSGNVSEGECRVQVRTAPTHGVNFGCRNEDVAWNKICLVSFYHCAVTLSNQVASYISNRTLLLVMGRGFVNSHLYGRGVSCAWHSPSSAVHLLHSAFLAHRTIFPRFLC
uniref:Uncharacterized protein n=1 Tax=Pyxicephalus adspersus TaxID=30357 RepID=A0AAV3A0A0_PYXAD|nr:TPA: hypothetical protein GDO54_016603 [Pyxicephalus adspersus]